MVMGSDSQFHVLAVDDSLIDRKLIERLLKTSSYQVTTVESGSKALEFLSLIEQHQHPNFKHPNFKPPSSSSSSSSLSSNNHHHHHHHQELEVNLIITDYCMPGMTGFDLLKKVKESTSLRNIPVVIMSSENVPSRISRCLEEGAEEFFLKPVRLCDVNKLKPHMMKNNKLTDQNQQETTHKELESVQKQQHQQQQQLQINTNKRKAAAADMDERVGVDRTRTRSYNNNGVATVI